MQADITNILIELNRAVKTLNFYPEGHPNRDEAVKNCYRLIMNLIKEEGEARLEAADKKISINGVHSAHPFSSSLGRELFLRKIHTVTFTKGLTERDMLTFLMLLVAKPEDIFQRGGAEKIIIRENTQGLLVNDLTFEIIESEREKERERYSDAESQEGDKESAMEREEEPLQQEDDSLQALLKRIEKEKDVIRYNDLAIRIVEKALHLIDAGEFDELFPVLKVFLRHALTKSLPEEIRKKARECLFQLLKEDTIRYLVLRIGRQDEPERTTIDHLLVMCEDRSVDIMLDALVDAEDASVRRRLFNVLVYFGDRIREKVEARLNDPRWFAVRQMVALLGALGGEGSLDALERAYMHEDIRVKKEVLKSLARIPSPRSSRLLISTIHDKEADRTLKAQAIISLAILKDKDAVDILGELATKRETFTDNTDLKKEAIKALGIIGDRRALPYLEKLATRRVWFRREANEELKNLAILSLGKIGGSEALDIVKRVCNQSTGQLYATCRRVLEGKQES